MGGRKEAQRRRFERLRAFDRDRDGDAWEAELLAGIDEAGVGPLAGPVVAAAVILPKDFFLPELFDSKRLGAAARSRCERAIRQAALTYAVARISPACIDRINILQAMLRAHGRALKRLSIPPRTVLIDGNRQPRIPVGVQVQLVVGGDGKSLAIAAASILAKCARDRTMKRLDRLFPGYGFARHKGYATEEHMEALRRLGVSPVHRRHFCRFLETEAAMQRQGHFPWHVEPRVATVRR